MPRQAEAGECCEGPCSQLKREHDLPDEVSSKEVFHLDGRLQPGPWLCEQLPLRCKWVEDGKSVGIATHHQWLLGLAADETAVDIRLKELSSGEFANSKASAGCEGEKEHRAGGQHLGSKFC